MKNLVTLIVLLALCTSVTAQVEVSGFGLTRETSNSSKQKQLKEYRFGMNSGKLLIEMNHVTVEGYDGNEVVISMPVESKEEDKRAAGLVGISGHGLRDNTGMGIHVTQGDDLAEIRLMNTFHEDSALIRVPKQLAISVIATRTYGGKKIDIKNIQGEIEVSTTLDDIKLEHITGPMTVKTFTGNIEVILDAPVRGPISLASSVGFIDVAMPVNTKADIDLRNTLGAIYASEEFNIDFAEREKEQSSIYDRVNEARVAAKVIETNRLTGRGTDATTIFGTGIQSSSRNSVIGTINGGGENISVRTAQGKIYLRTTGN